MEGIGRLAGRARRTVHLGVGRDAAGVGGEDHAPRLEGDRHERVVHGL